MSITDDLVHVVSEALDASDTIVAVLEPASDVPGGLRFISINRAFSNATGCQQENLVGRPLAEVAAPEAAATLHGIEATVGDLGQWRGELACLNQLSRRIWIGCHLTPARPAGRATHLYVMIGRDITTRRAETLNSNSLNNLFAKAFQVADVPFGIINDNGRFVMTNQCWDTQLGYPAGALAGKLATDFLAAPSRQTLQAGRDRQNADAIAFQSDIELLHASGQSLPVTLSSAAVNGLDRGRFNIVITRPRGVGAVSATRSHSTLGADEATHFQVAGRLRFIDLDPIREALKDRWDSVGKRAMEAAEHIIRKRLTSADTFERDLDRGFTICFAIGTQAEATFRATAIAREIRLHLIGLGEDEDQIAIQVAVARIAITPDRPASDQIAEQLKIVSAEGLRAARAPLEPPRILTVYRTATATPSAAYVLPVPRPSTAGSTIMPESTPSQDLAPINWVLAIDTAKPLHTVLVDITFEQFVRRDRTEAFLALCTNLSPAIRPHLNLLLTGVPTGVTTSLIQDITRRLKPFCGGVGWHLEEWGQPSFDLRACPLAWAVVDLRAWKGPPSVPPERLKRVAGLLGAYGIKTMATRVVSSDGIKLLHSAGVHCATLDDCGDAATGRNA